MPAAVVHARDYAGVADFLPEVRKVKVEETAGSWKAHVNRMAAAAAWCVPREAISTADRTTHAAVQVEHDLSRSKPEPLILYWTRATSKFSSMESSQIEFRVQRHVDTNPRPPGRWGSASTPFTSPLLPENEGKQPAACQCFNKPMT